MTERKTFTATPELKQDGQPGEVLVRFATTGVIDADNDVTLPGAFGRQAVRMQPYGHQTGAASIGKGETYEADGAAYAAMRINLNMEAGRELYESLRFDFENGPPLQEFSYIFDILDSEPGEWDGQRVRILRRLKVHSVDPVFLGAGVGTGTVAVKCTDCKQTDDAERRRRYDAAFARGMREGVAELERRKREPLKRRMDEMDERVKEYGIV